MLVEICWLRRLSIRLFFSAAIRLSWNASLLSLLASVLTPEPGLGVPDVGLGDVMPDPANIPPGCRFHPRCPEAFARCSIEAPKITRTATGLVECHLAEAGS